MIPRAYITQWREFAPWSSDIQVEQDLIISRIILGLFSDNWLKDRIAFRGGTALHKLFVKPPARYSEDIDLVQIEHGNIGDILTAIRNSLQFLGEAKYVRSVHSNKLICSFRSEYFPSVVSKIKIEINTRDHFTVLGFKEAEFSMKSNWITGECLITTYSVEELLGTKLRALFQRSKGRDLFDLWIAGRYHLLSEEKIVNTFLRYLKEEGLAVKKREFLKNFEEKLTEAEFLGDIKGLIHPQIEFNLIEAANYVRERLIVLMPE